jgi:hypothetical protein
VFLFFASTRVRRQLARSIRRPESGVLAKL